MIEEIAILAALVGTGAAAYSDWKTSYIPDELNYALIALGAILLLFRFPIEQGMYHFAAAGIVFLVDLVFYFFGQLGGGDVKLFTGLALLLPTYPTTITAYFGFNPIIAPYPPVVSIFFVSTVVAMLFISLGYIVKLINDRKKIKSFERKAWKGLGFSLILLPLFYIWYLINQNMIVIAVPMMVGAFLLSFKNDILKLYIVMEKPISKLNDDDVLAIELMSKSMKKKLGIGTQKTLWDAQINDIKKNAKKHKIKKILVSEYLPRFGPFIFFAIIFVILVGDQLLWLLFA